MALTILKKSSKVPQIGDIFCLQLEDGNYYFGRVVTKIQSENDKYAYNGASVIYIYNHSSKSKDIELEYLNRNNLLIPPIIVNVSPWKEGVFETIDNIQISKDDLLEKHCFFQSFRKEYVDETGTKIWFPDKKNAGELILWFHPAIEYKINKALGKVVDVPKTSISNDFELSNLENDEAIMFLSELKENPSIGLLEEKVKYVLETKDYLEKDPAQEALTSAEVIAYLSGKPKQGISESTKEDLELIKVSLPNKIVSTALVKKSIAATLRVIKDSELRELWNESKEFDRWVEEIKDLLSRLKSL